MSQKATKLTTRKLGEILPTVLHKLEARYQANPQAVLEAWPQIIAPELAPMTLAVSFEDGVLFVKVKNSTLLSLLSNSHDKQTLINTIRNKFPGICIRNIVFRIG